MSSRTYRYEKRKREKIELLGGKCVKCGSEENLDFDHIDPATKRFSLAGWLDCNSEKVMEELKKCQLLCTDCHKAKTKSEKLIEHGTVKAYGRGCRCQECRLAKSRYIRRWKSGSPAGSI